MQEVKLGKDLVYNVILDYYRLGDEKISKATIGSLETKGLLKRTRLGQHHFSYKLSNRGSRYMNELLTRGLN